MMLSERQALLLSIYRNFHDSTPRMVYADYLEEHAECDRDIAQCEYIRDGSLRWLRENWMRLIPKFMEVWCRPKMFPKDYRFNRSNEDRLREFKCLVVVQGSILPEQYAYIEFDTGFAVRSRWLGRFAALRCRSSLLDDQPFIDNRYGSVAGAGDKNMPHPSRVWLKSEEAK